MCILNSAESAGWSPWWWDQSRQGVRLGSTQPPHGRLGKEATPTAPVRPRDLQVPHAPLVPPSEAGAHPTCKNFCFSFADLLWWYVLCCEFEACLLLGWSSRHAVAPQPSHWNLPQHKLRIFYNNFCCFQICQAALLIKTTNDASSEALI